MTDNPIKDHACSFAAVRIIHVRENDTAHLPADVVAELKTRNFVPRGANVYVTAQGWDELCRVIPEKE